MTKEGALGHLAKYFVFSYMLAFFSARRGEPCARAVCYVVYIICFVHPVPIFFFFFFLFFLLPKNFS